MTTVVKAPPWIEENNSEKTERKKAVKAAGRISMTRKMFARLFLATAFAATTNTQGAQAIIAKTFPIWKTINLGTGLKTAGEFRDALISNGFRIGDWGNDILGKSAFKLSPKETSIKLVRVTVAELGFKNGATRADIYKRAIELGLELCPNEVGPQLRLQYKNQPKGEWFLIAIEPISDWYGDLFVFFVAHYDDGLWLFGTIGGPDDFWSGDSRWMFVRPRK